MKKKLLCVSLGLALTMTACSTKQPSTEGTPAPQTQETATATPGSANNQSTSNAEATVQANTVLGFQLEHNPSVFPYTEYNEGVSTALFTAEKGMTGNIVLSVTTREQSIPDTIENIKMMSFVQKYTTEETVIGTDKIPVTVLRFYDKDTSDMVSYYYLWERDVNGTNKTYLIERSDRVGSDGKESKADDFTRMLDSFTYVDVK